MKNSDTALPLHCVNRPERRKGRAELKQPNVSQPEARTNARPPTIANPRLCFKILAGWPRRRQYR